ncbi:MAG: DNA mismatch repair protein MutS [Candidatus Hydrogenedens sp.]|nr:DNA mismatch repair protein MutS [Candidatus Hydrogenedens sp.]
MANPILAEAEYGRRVERFQREAERLQVLSDRLSDARLVVFLAGIGVLFGGFQGWWAYAWLTVPLFGFLTLVFVHERATRRLKLAQDGVALYQRGLARIRGDWAGGEYAVWSGCPEGHLYARDIDLFGIGGLFDLLCQARTSMGAQTLADWLLRAAEPQEIAARQAAVQELAPNLDLREDFALLAGAVRTEVEPDDLQAWAAEQTMLALPWVQRGTMALASIGLLAIIAALVVQNLAPVMLVLPLSLLWLGYTRRAFQSINTGLSPIVRELRVLSELLQRIETETFQSPRLVDMRASLSTHGVSAGQAVERLRRWAEWTDLQNNQLFFPFTLLFAWPALMGVMVERWRAAHGSALRQHWLRALGDIEALASLAALAYEHPDYAWPEVAEGAPRFEATDLAHALIPEAHCVRNSLVLNAETPVLIVSGSNMSGKSTLLRAIGLSIALAQAGAPVPAKRLVLTPLALGAVIRVEDSVRKGASMFYAEIERFRALLELTEGDRPLLFLSDEILHGTNTHDRVEGAKALIRGLIERRALGLATTHDLALTAFAEELAGRARNVHFQDRLVGGKLAFDYTLRDGVVQKSNALELMRSIGLPV